MAKPDGKVGKAVNLSSLWEEYFKLDRDWLNNYVSRAIGKVHDCHLETVKAEMLRKPTIELQQKTMSSFIASK